MSGGDQHHLLLLVAFVILAVTVALFTAGSVNFYNSTGSTIEAPRSIIEDPTFYVLFSQVLPNILNSIFDLVKAYDDKHARWRSMPLFLGNTVAIVALSLAAPILYGVADRTETWVQVQTMILSMAASVAITFAGIVGVFEAGAKRQRDRDEEVLAYQVKEQVAEQMKRKSVRTRLKFWN